MSHLKILEEKKQTSNRHNKCKALNFDYYSKTTVRVSQTENLKRFFEQGRVTGS